MYTYIHIYYIYILYIYIYIYIFTSVFLLIFLLFVNQAYNYSAINSVLSGSVADFLV